MTAQELFEKLSTYTEEQRKAMEVRCYHYGDIDEEEYMPTHVQSPAHYMYKDSSGRFIIDCIKEQPIHKDF